MRDHCEALSGVAEGHAGGFDMGREFSPILLVEGDHRLRRVVSASLRQLGLNVLEAADAAAAKAVLQKADPSIVILSMDCAADEDGHTSDALTKSRFGKDRILLLTSTYRVSDAWRRKLQPRATIYKPFDTRFLCRVVRGYMNTADGRNAARNG
jgi:DNA-binding response OmpR family regulator